MGYKSQTCLQHVHLTVILPTALFVNDTIDESMYLQTSASYVINSGRGADIKTSMHKINFILSYTYFFKAREKKYGTLSIIDELKKTKKKHNSKSRQGN